MSRTWPFFLTRPQPQDGVLAWYHHILPCVPDSNNVCMCASVCVRKSAMGMRRFASRTYTLAHIDANSLLTCQTLISSPVYSGQTSILFQDELATFENAVHIFRLAIWDGIHDTKMFVSSSYGSLVSCKGNCTEIVQYAPAPCFLF